jgi:hypothetical protein
LKEAKHLNLIFYELIQSFTIFVIFDNNHNIFIELKISYNFSAQNIQKFIFINEMEFIHLNIDGLIMKFVITPLVQYILIFLSHNQNIKTHFTDSVNASQMLVKLMKFESLVY